MSDKKKPVFKKKKKIEEMTDTEYVQKKLRDSLNKKEKEEMDEPLQLELDLGFGDFFDSSDPDEYAD